jgi:hypothetical protein
VPLGSPQALQAVLAAQQQELQPQLVPPVRS